MICILYGGPNDGEIRDVEYFPLLVAVPHKVPYRMDSDPLASETGYSVGRYDVDGCVYELTNDGVTRARKLKWIPPENAGRVN